MARGWPLRVAVIDLDVHQGNGTAHIFQGDDSVFTLSLHGARNFPFAKEPSDLDVPLPDGCGDAQYLDALDQALETLDHRCKPDLVLIWRGPTPHGRPAGASCHPRWAGSARRQVFDWAWRRRVPGVFVMAGGYGQRPGGPPCRRNSPPGAWHWQYHQRWQNAAP